MPREAPDEPPLNWHRDQQPASTRRRRTAVARQEELLKEKLEALKKAPVPQATLDLIDKDQDVVVEKIKMINARTDYEKWKNGGDENSPGVQQKKAVSKSRRSNSTDGQCSISRL